eukprot:568849-Rhodomonas_salina.1
MSAGMSAEEGACVSGGMRVFKVFEGHACVKRYAQTHTLIPRETGTALCLHQGCVEIRRHIRRGPKDARRGAYVGTEMRVDRYTSGPRCA